MQRKRLFLNNFLSLIIATLVTWGVFANRLQFDPLMVRANAYQKGEILLTDIDEQQELGKTLTGGNLTLATVILLGLLSGLTLAGLAGLAYLLFTRMGDDHDGGGDHYHYHGGGYGNIDHADHSGSGYGGGYNDYYRRRKRRNTKIDEQVASKLKTNDKYVF